MSFKVWYLDQTGIRPGRVRWSNEAYFSFIPSAIFNLLVFAASIFVALTLPLPTLTKLTTISALFLWASLMMLLLALSKIKFPFGNNRVSRKSGFGIALVGLLLSIIALVMLAARLSFPLGEVVTLPYVLAGLILGVIMLTGQLVFTMAPSRLLSNLQDLRNDIVFLRVDIDEALRRYEVLTEGETLPDALQKELSEILRDLNVIGYAHSNMHQLLEKMMLELPSGDATQEERVLKLKQINLDGASYLLHDAKCREIQASLGPQLNKLNKKMVRLSAVTEDWASSNTIRSSLAERLELMERFHTQLGQRKQAVDYYLSNPNKIPPELKDSTNKPKTEGT